MTRRAHVQQWVNDYRSRPAIRFSPTESTEPSLPALVGFRIPDRYFFPRPPPLTGQHPPRCGCVTQKGHLNPHAWVFLEIAIRKKINSLIFSPKPCGPLAGWSSLTLTTYIVYQYNESTRGKHWRPPPWFGWVATRATQPEQKVIRPFPRQIRFQSAAPHRKKRRARLHFNKPPRSTTQRSRRTILPVSGAGKVYGKPGIDLTSPSASGYG